MTEQPEASPAVPSKQDPHRWANEFPNLNDATRRLLEDYSHIPADQVESHVMKIVCTVDEHPYPCIGRFRFLDLGLNSSPVHDEVLSRIKNGQKYLDLGCCFGQEIRYLTSKGCPSENLYGADLREVFIEYGYELFRDRNTLKATFLSPADIFAKEPLSQLDGQMDIINASSFFHLFSWDESFTAAKRVVNFLRPVQGQLIIGRQVGNPNSAGPKESNDKNSSFRHNPESWKKFWDDVGQATNSRWEAEVRWDPKFDLQRLSEATSNAGAQIFYFVVRRL